MRGLFALLGVLALVAAFAAAACGGSDEEKTTTRAVVREILPLCPRCDALITQAGRDGRVLKATGERWYGGHTVGTPEPSWTPAQD